MQKMTYNQITPLTEEQLDSLNSIFLNLSSNQLAWISGYLWGIVRMSMSKDSINILQSSGVKDSSTVKNEITLISGSQTGNALGVAEKLRDSLVAENLNVVLYRARDFNVKKLCNIKLLIFIISTYGEGEPPEEAITLYKYLFSKRAPKMKNVSFSVFSLGDRSYKYFAKAGKDLDLRLEELGAYRLYKRVDADIDFQDIADAWIKNIVLLYKKQSVLDMSSAQNNDYSNISKDIVYSTECPLTAYLLVNQKITSRRAFKDVHHLEIDISHSDMKYQPGDSLGVWYENDLHLIDEFLEIFNFTGNEVVQVKKIKISLNEALCKHYELTQNTYVVVKNIIDITQNRFLLDLYSDREKLIKFILVTPIVDMLRQVKLVLTPQELLKILLPMRPRFYSIASSQLEVGQEVHITVGVVRYVVNGRVRTGGASGYLVDRLKENDGVRVFVEPNSNFRLPEDSSVPIIMIGAGTGIAPFRAFMQQRSANQSVGKNWLFFGNLRFIDDFLYQVEWQRYIKDGLLTKIDTAWSRDQINKIYVQDKLLNSGVKLWHWIQEGAYIYVCGDAKKMARDVERTLLTITSQQGKMNLEKANYFWEEMRMKFRYQRDVY